MSLSKLESLPNELLIDTIEKYVNGVDVLVALAHQLNSRFDALITQCQQLRFDFIRCRKDDFRLCMGLLPAYLDNIGELALSERDTPGQIHAFLSFFPSFAPFKRLRTLHFHYNGEAVDTDQVEESLLTLSDTNVETLSIKTTNTEAQPFSNDVIAMVLSLPTLKRVSIAIDSNNGRSDWDHLISAPSNVEHLTMSGLHCEWKDLQCIFRWIPRLEYLNVAVIPTSFRGFRHILPVVPQKVNITPLLALRTLILHFDDDDPTTFEMLAQLLNATPILQRLEISAHRALINASDWEKLIQKSLPLLTNFILTTSMSPLEESDIHHVLSSFQTSFWIKKKTFNIIVTAYERLYRNSVPKDHVRGRERRQFDTNENSVLYPTVVGYWMALQPASNDEIRTVNSVTNLCLYDNSFCRSHRYYFGNVKYLAVDHLSENLVEWMTTFINCSRVTELAISISDKKSDAITLLMARTMNISSLQISLDQLIGHQAARIERNNLLKCLDVSEKQHTLNEENIIAIARFFPYIEHLAINTLNLGNVPMLKANLPHLRSLTFKIIDPHFDRFDDYKQKIWDDRLRSTTQFLFQRETNWITIWVDTAAFQDHFWKTFATRSPQVA